MTVKRRGTDKCCAEHRGGWGGSSRRCGEGWVCVMEAPAALADLTGVPASQTVLRDFSVKARWRLQAFPELSGALEHMNY